MEWHRPVTKKGVSHNIEMDDPRIIEVTADLFSKILIYLVYKLLTSIVKKYAMQNKHKNNRISIFFTIILSCCFLHTMVSHFFPTRNYVPFQQCEQQQYYLSTLVHRTGKLLQNLIAKTNKVERLVQCHLIVGVQQSCLSPRMSFLPG